MADAVPLSNPHAIWTSDKTWQRVNANRPLLSRRTTGYFLLGDANLKSMVAFDLGVGSWIDQACLVAGRSLSEEERRNYDLPADGPRVCASP